MREPYYQDDWVTLYHARCEDVLPELGPESVALVVTSPPYNKSASLKNRKGGHTSNWQRYADHSWYDDEMTREQYEDWQLAILQMLAKSITHNGSICYNAKPISERNREYDPRDWLLRSRLWAIRQTIIWHSKACCQFNSNLFYPFHELLFWLYPKLGKPRRVPQQYQQWTSVWEILPDREADWHPCAFPRELASRCILALSNPGETVLDPFAGACTVGVAAKELGRRAVLIERDEGYCQKAAERLASTQMTYLELIEDCRPAQRALVMEG